MSTFPYTIYKKTLKYLPKLQDILYFIISTFLTTANNLFTLNPIVFLP